MVNGNVENAQVSRSNLLPKADLELARRSVASCLFPCFLLVVVAAFTRYHREHPVAIVATGAVLLFAAIGRLALAWRMLSKIGAPNPAHRIAFRVGALMNASVWSIFACVSMHLYGQNWIGWFVLLVTTGIAAGAITSFSPDYFLSATYVTVLLAPLVGLTAVVDTAGGYATTSVIALYLGFLLVVGWQQSESYWQAVTNSALLEERGAYLTALTEDSPLPVAVADTEHRLQLCNRAFERLFGFEQSELAGRKLFEVFHTLPEERALFLDTIKLGNSVHLVTRRPRKDLTEVDVEIRAVPLMLNGTMNGLLVLFQDVTERNVAERRLRQHSEEIGVLSEMASLLQSCQSADEAYNVIGATSRRLLPHRAGSLSILSPSGNTVETVAVWGDGFAGERVFAPEDCWSMRRGQPHRFDSTGHGSVTRCRHTGTTTTISNSLCLPLLGQGEVLGILHLQTPNSHADVPPESEQKLATVLGEQIALSLSSLKLREKLRNQSIRDPLTGLFNRRYMEESLEREVSRAIRTNTPVAFLLMDIDHFKRFNDTFGHLAGDALLRSFGDFLLRRTRGQDIACRYGGEEFALVLCGSSLEGAMTRAQTLRREVKDLSVQHGGQLLGTISLSIGAVAFPSHASSLEEMVRIADLALYAAKQQGRDRTISAAEIPETHSANVAPIQT